MGNHLLYTSINYDYHDEKYKDMEVLNIRYHWTSDSSYNQQGQEE
jgi:hypothetical protein